MDLAVALGDASDSSLVVRMTKGIQGGGRQRVQILRGGATWRTMAPFEVGFEDGICQHPISSGQVNNLNNK